jgi:hypothetical protein
MQGCYKVYFQTKNANLGKLSMVIVLDHASIFYGHLVYYTAIWYIKRPFGILNGHLVYYTAILWSFGKFSPGLVCYIRKTWQPWSQT